jgi:hypothetical protein
MIGMTVRRRSVSVWAHATANDKSSLKRSLNANYIRQGSSSQVCRSKTPYSNLEVMDRRTADFMSMMDSGLAHAGEPSPTLNMKESERVWGGIKFHVNPVVNGEGAPRVDAKHQHSL